MGADIKSLRTRIKSVSSTQQLTRAMGLVASSKIRKATERMLHGRDYAAALEQVLSALTASPTCARSPYMQVRESGKTRLIVIAGDRGLAGGYNANIFRTVKDYPDAEIIPIGKRACDRFGGEVRSCEKFDSRAAYDLAVTLCNDFAAGEYDRLGILYTQYVSMMSQQPEIVWVLPLTRDEGAKTSATLFEPDEETILRTAVPEYVTGRIVAAVRESFASEVVARRMAMDSAGKNAAEMIADLQLQYNRARQGSITQEITEIVAGANA
ncbi:MAG: ATP synthase F1 subunit gamma [Clostridia bacterium]|nr:ATP synthase F1 subunit gamma [Clostridia bacterium]